MIKEVCNMARANSEMNTKSITSLRQFSIQEIVLSTIQHLGITMYFFDSQTEAPIPTSGDSDLFNENGQYFLKNAVILPLSKVIVDNVPRSEIIWEHSSLAAGHDNIEHCVKFLTKRMFALTVNIFHVRNNHLPLIISDIGWIRCSSFEILETLYKVRNNYSFNTLILNYLTNKVVNIKHGSLI